MCSCQEGATVFKALRPITSSTYIIISEICTCFWGEERKMCWRHVPVLWERTKRRLLPAADHQCHLEGTQGR